MSSVKRKREEDGGLSHGFSDEVSSVEKREDDSKEDIDREDYEKRSRVKKEIDSINEKNVDGENMKDSEFQETLKSLQKRENDDDSTLSEDENSDKTAESNQDSQESDEAEDKN